MAPAKVMLLTSCSKLHWTHLERRCLYKCKTNKSVYRAHSTYRQHLEVLPAALLQLFGCKATLKCNGKNITEVCASALHLVKDPGSLY